MVNLRDPVWEGISALIAITGTLFAMLVFFFGSERIRHNPILRNATWGSITILFPLIIIISIGSIAMVITRSPWIGMFIVASLSFGWGLIWNTWLSKLPAIANPSVDSSTSSHLNPDDSSSD